MEGKVIANIHKILWSSTVMMKHEIGSPLVFDCHCVILKSLILEDADFIKTIIVTVSPSVEKLWLLGRALLQT